MTCNCNKEYIKRVIGVTRTFNWTVTTGGEDVSLEGRNLTLQLMEPRGIVVDLPFSTTGDVVSFTWQGDDQTKIGLYSLILWENYGEDSQRRVDIHNFVELMPWSETDSGEFADLTEETIELDTADFGPDIIVVDNLNSTSASDALSANMGRVLNETKQDVIQDLDAIRSGAAAGATAYQKPAAGIPKTDLASGVQASLDKADNGEFQIGTLPTQSDLDKVEYIMPSQASRTVPVSSTLLVKTNVIGYTGHDVYRYPTGISVPAGCAVRVGTDRNFLWLTNVGGGMFLLERFGDTFVNTTPNAQTIYVAVTPTAASIVLYYYDTPLVSVQERLAQKQDIIPDLATIRSGAEAGATAYQKPAAGIPKTDLASGVQASLDKADAAAPLSELQDYAKIDGYYDSMAVGVAKNIEGIDVSSKTFTFAKIDGTDGLAKINNVKGNGLAWNQMLENGDFSNGTTNWSALGTQSSITVANKEATITKVSTGQTGAISYYNKTLAYNTSHKYFIAGFIKSNTTGQAMCMGFHSTNGSTGGNTIISTTSEDFVRESAIVSPINNTDRFSLRAGTGSSPTGTSGSAKNVICFDLTLMFGAGNEPSTVEEFEAMFPLPYYDYNAGELLSNKTEQVKVVGFNQWDEEWESGYLGYGSNNKGLPIDNPRTIRSKNFIPILPNTTYYFKYPTAHYLWYYDGEKNCLAAPTYLAPNRTFVTPSNARFLKFACEPSYGTTYNHDICINFSDTSRNGTYEPYKTNTIDLNLPTLTGKLNGEGESVVVFPDGMKSAGSVYDEIVGNKAIKRIGVVDLGTLTWAAALGITGFSGSGLDDYRYNENNNNSAQPASLLAKYNHGEGSTFDTAVHAITGDGQYAFYQGGSGIALRRLWVGDSSYSTPESFKTAMSGVLLYYELNTPLEYTLDAPIPETFQSYKGGTLMQLPQNTAAPTTAPHAMDVTYSIDAAGILTGLPQNYVSKESLQAMLNAMQSAGLFASYTMTYNATTKKYDFTFTANS